MKRFGNISKQSFKNHKNSEIACYYTISQCFKKMLSFGNAASFHSGLIPLKTACKKKRGIVLGDGELEEFY